MAISIRSKKKKLPAHPHKDYTSILSKLLRAISIIALTASMAGCGGQSIPQVIGNLVSSGTISGIATPSPGQWVAYGGNVSINSNGSFTFGTTGGSGQGIGYVYTGYNGNLSGKTITLTYTVSGTGTVLPSAASGYGSAQVRLFLWRKGDDLTCSATTEWYRQWSASGVGPLTVGQHTISAAVSDPGWTDCLGKSDANQLAGAAANVLGVGFTFGAEFFGHGAYSTGSNTFTVNSFSVQ